MGAIAPGPSARGVPHLKKTLQKDRLLVSSKIKCLRLTSKSGLQESV